MATVGLGPAYLIFEEHQSPALALSATNEQAFQFLST